MYLNLSHYDRLLPLLSILLLLRDMYSFHGIIAIIDVYFG